MGWANLIERIGQARNSHQRAGDLFSNVRGAGSHPISAFERQAPTPITTPESTIGPGPVERLANAGIDKLEEDLEKYDANLPEDYYVEFSHHLYLDALTRNGNNPSMALQELYESLKSNDNYPVTGPDGAIQTLQNRYNQEMCGEEFDKVRHYLVSAYLAYTNGADIAAMLGAGKEIVDAVGPGDADWSDMVANSEGIAFGEHVREGNIAW